MKFTNYDRAVMRFNLLLTINTEEAPHLDSTMFDWVKSHAKYLYKKLGRKGGGKGK